MRVESRRAILTQLKSEAIERRQYAMCEQYKRLVCQQAWRAWRMLPNHTKSWIDVNDMINHGMWLVYRYLNKVTSANTFDPKRSNSVTTGLQHILHNVFIYDYVAVYGAWKRGWEKSKDGKLVPLYMNSLEGLQQQEEDRGFSFNPPELVVSEDTITDNVMTKCFVIPAMEKIYHQASGKLKSEMVEWFWFKSAKVHTKGKPFQRMAKEFRVLCNEQKLESNDCLHLMRSPECLDTLSRTIFGIPYSHSCSPVVH